MTAPCPYCDGTGDVETFGERLRAARVRAGLSQGDVAKRLNLSDANVVSQWETGVTTPRPRNRIAAEKLLGLEPSRHGSRAG